MLKYEGVIAFHRVSGEVFQYMAQWKNIRSSLCGKWVNRTLKLTSLIRQMKWHWQERKGAPCVSGWIWVTEETNTNLSTML